MKAKVFLPGRSRKADKHVSTPSQLEAFLSLWIAETQRQKSLKNLQVFFQLQAERLEPGKKKKERKRKNLAALISSHKTQRYKNTHSAQPESASEASPPGTLLPCFTRKSAAPVSREVV